MEKLTKAQADELRCLDEYGPLYKNAPPEVAIGDLRYLFDNGFINWTSRGYLLSPAGRAALAKEQRE